MHPPYLNTQLYALPIWARKIEGKLAVDGHEIVFTKSLISQSETIVVNGRKVSKKWTLRNRSHHTFEINNQTYHLTFDTCHVPSQEVTVFISTNQKRLHTSRFSFEAIKSTNIYNLALWGMVVLNGAICALNLMLSRV